MVFDVQHDATPIAGWMTLRWATVTWVEARPGATEVRWAVEFDRELAPAFYFAPPERYAARLAAGYLVDTVATPRG